MQYYATYNIQCDVQYNVTSTMSININNCLHWNLFGIHLWSPLYVYSHFISALRIYLYFILIHRRKMIVFFLLPLPKKILHSNVLLQVGLAVIVFFAETVQNQLEPNNNPELIRDSESCLTKCASGNWCTNCWSQFRIVTGGKHGIGFRERGWSGANRPRPI